MVLDSRHDKGLQHRQITLKTGGNGPSAGPGRFFSHGSYYSARTYVILVDLHINNVNKHAHVIFMTI